MKGDDLLHHHSHTHHSAVKDIDPLDPDNLNHPRDDDHDSTASNPLRSAIAGHKTPFTDNLDQSEKLVQSRMTGNPGYDTFHEEEKEDAVSVTGGTKKALETEAEEDEYSKTAQGIVIVLVGGVLFSAAAAAMQDASRIPAMQMMAIRCFVGVLLSLGAILQSGDDVVGPHACREWYFLRTLLGGLGMSCYFLSVDWLPLGNAMSLFATNVGFALFSAKFCLNEETTLLHLVCFIFLFMGTICIAQPEALFGVDRIDKESPDPSHFWPGFLCAIGGAAFYGIQFWPLKRATETGASKLGMILGVNALGAPIAILVSLLIPSQAFVAPPYNWEETIAIIAVALTGFYTQASFVYAIEMIDGATISLLYSVDIIWAYLWQMLFFHQISNWLALFGSGLLFFAVVVTVAIKRRRKELALPGSLTNLIDGDLVLNLDNGLEGLSDNIRSLAESVQRGGEGVGTLSVVVVSEDGALRTGLITRRTPSDISSTVTSKRHYLKKKRFGGRNRKTAKSFGR